MKGHWLEIIISFIVALLLIIFRDIVAKLIISFQVNVWGFKFGETEIKATKFVCIIIAIFLIIWDILIILGISKFRGG